MQIFLEQQGINSGRVITPNDLYYVVAVAFIERERSNVVHRGFQADGRSSGWPELLFSRIQRSGYDQVSSAELPDITRDAVAYSLNTFRNPATKHVSW